VFGAGGEAHAWGTKEGRRRREEKKKGREEEEKVS